MTSHGWLSARPLETTEGVYLSCSHTACCVAFGSKCAGVHCTDSHRSRLFPEHVTTPSRKTEKPAAHRARGDTVTSRGMRGRRPPYRPSTAAPSSSDLRLNSPTSHGWRLGKVSRCDWNTEPHSEGGGHRATRSQGFTACQHLHCMEIYCLHPMQSRFTIEDS